MAEDHGKQQVLGGDVKELSQLTYAVTDGDRPDFHQPEQVQRALAEQNAGQRHQHQQQIEQHMPGFGGALLQGRVGAEQVGGTLARTHQQAQYGEHQHRDAE
jgi:hypothetical protein